MEKEDLLNTLKEYTEDELYYREYYYAKQNPEKYKGFVDNLDIELIKKCNMLISEGNLCFIPSFIAEDIYFSNKEDNNVFVLKHKRYTPVFHHKHEFFELIYVLYGSCRQSIGGEDISLAEGDICIISPEVEHSISVFDDSIAINVLIRKSTFNNTFLEVLSDENILSSFFTKILYTKEFNNYIIFRTYKNGEIINILSEIIYEYLEARKYSSKILDNYLMILFAYLLRNEEVKVELPKELSKSTKHLVEIIAYIQGNYKTVTLNELSERFHFTVPYLSKLIKVNTGHTFKDMIQTIKLNKAVELLEFSNLKIHDISDTIGYENTTHFTRTFKGVYGVSPGEYKKNLITKK
jgi:AraC-like DNA-binding protein/mannose-6-phosphate isomerase-like protein (cupin superfamily)